MFSLAWQTIRARRGALAAAFVAVFCGSALVTASGILLDSGARGGIAPQRYAAAPVVVTGPQTLPVTDDLDQRFAERVTLPAARADDIARVPGVRAAVGDVSVHAGLRRPGGDVPLVAHGWSATRLGPVPLAGGRAPEAPDEVALDGALAARSGVRTGDTVDLSVGAVASGYRVVGITAPAQDSAFLTDAQARVLSGRPDQVDAVAVLADPGADATALAARIGHDVPGVTTAVGADRADAEFLDIGSARSFLMLIAGSFGGTMLMIVVLVVASTLGLSIQQRRREFALLRAIAATPRQVRRLITTETLLLGSVAAALGTVPGIGLSFLLRTELARFGALPAGFRFVVGPLPALAAVVACVLAAVVAGLIAARRATRINPVAALGEAAVEPPKLGRTRLLIGWVLALAGVVNGVALPLALDGTAAAGSAATSALLLVVAVALLGPRLFTATAGVFGRLGMSRTVAGFLASTSARARSRRLSSAATPLIMGVALAAVQIFTVTTTSTAAERQVADGVRADHVLVARDGIAPPVADAVRQVPGITAAVPVARTSVLASYRELGDTMTESYAAQGITTAGLGSVMDLGVQRGNLGGLTGNTVAVSETAAGTFGVDVGSTLALRLGDGTPYTARVVAVYEKGLGFGDVTLPNDVVVAHTTSRLDDAILLAGTDSAALRNLLAAHPEIQLTDGVSFTGGSSTVESSVSLLLNLVLIAFLAIAVVNILVLATAARVREFALLRLVGAKPRQVRGMMRGEATVIVVAAVVLGSVAALPPLIGISLSLTGSAIPTVPALAYLGIVAAAVAFGWGSIAIATRITMRPTPVVAMRTED
ncbi:ABC transporter permease [Amycolatopsis pithecellobii]|uniref:FtsX-like permease family protein n=1 Tax=Amycolatopsis pithecellobii TaxID=664692 RepID=A0A6N7YW03_9PSEU|nr:ABC transporter permease [Amycolatopsis pithecellobii]MTD57257.1 FtsX-like permease family protein [Amycolatopsis pithecellobii]